MIEAFCIYYLSADIIMMPFYKGENRESEKYRELPKATQLIRGGLRFKCKSMGVNSRANSIEQTLLLPGVL